MMSLFCSKPPIASILTQCLSQSPHNGLQGSPQSVSLLTLSSVLIYYYSIPCFFCSKNSGLLPMSQTCQTCSHMTCLSASYVNGVFSQHGILGYAFFSPRLYIYFPFVGSLLFLFGSLRRLLVRGEKIMGQKQIELS